MGDLNHHVRRSRKNPFQEDFGVLATVVPPSPQVRHDRQMPLVGGAENTPQSVDMLVVQDVDARVAEVKFQTFEASTLRASCDLVQRIISERVDAAERD